MRSSTSRSFRGVGDRTASSEWALDIEDPASSCGPIHNPHTLQLIGRRFQKLEWAPQPQRFLLVYCVRGQISNRVLCLRNHLLLAAVLNRTLVVPLLPEEQHLTAYDMRLVWDLERTRRCTAAASVLSTEEYVARFGRHVSVDRVQCWQGPQTACLSDPDKRDLDCPTLILPGHALNFSQPPSLGRHPAVPLYLDPDSHMRKRFLDPDASHLDVATGGSCMGDVISFEDAAKELGALRDRMLAVGDLVDRTLEHSFLPFPAFEQAVRVGPGCPAARGVMLPPEAVVQRAERLADTLFGPRRRYVSVHWRRGDWASFCAAAVLRDGTCASYSPRQAASCTLRTALRHDLQHVFLSTNAPADEVAAFKQYVEERSRGAVAVHTLSRDDHVALDPSWVRPGSPLEVQQHLLSVLLDKLVAAFGTVFLGTQVSTFSKDVIGMRHSIGTISCDDSYVCFGEKAWGNSTGVGGVL